MFKPVNDLYEPEIQTNFDHFSAQKYPESLRPYTINTYTIGNADNITIVYEFLRLHLDSLILSTLKNPAALFTKKLSTKIDLES